MKIIKTASLSVALLLAIFATHSLSANSISKKKASDFKEIFFPKIKKYSIKIECVSYEREFVVGKPAKMTFRIKNLSSKPLVVYEWFMNEPFNLKIYYTPWTKGMKKPRKEDWMVLTPKIPKKAKHMPLELESGNYVYIDKFLPFIANMKLTAPKEFVVYAELNLTSITKRSPYIKITLTPPPVFP
jgi:hypothetical protein